jgi:hypothetical protein
MIANDLQLTFRELKHNSPNGIARKIAWRLPRRVVMWCFYRVLAEATTGKYGKTNVADLVALDAVDRFAKDNNL